MSDTRNPPAFTKGPWKYGHLGTEVLWIGPGYNQTPVAHVDHDMEFARDNSRANAALISAAPELYEALAKMTPEIARILRNDWSRTSDQELGEIFQAAVTALRKARGEG